MQDGIRNANFANIVQRGRPFNQFALLFTHAKQLTKELGIERHTFDVQARFLGSGFNQLTDAVDNFPLVIGDHLVKADVLKRHYDVFGK